ncbi:Reverse transcriptase [Phytophthora palmivora]|uniref:Reverse transcriptase n=1 Tax=Phytophthora palmivora TaxID=4796 RepID=A0A2P4XSX6_9STRA|nr:Reverse transcriptase [Phytophthora palmivora]
MKYALVMFRVRATIENKPGKLNVLADALSRRPDYELAHVSRVTADLYDWIHLAYQADENSTTLVWSLFEGKAAKVDNLSARQRSQLHRYELADALLHYRIPCSNDEDLKYDIILEVHDAPMRGHLGLEKTYQTVSQTLWWPHMYKWVVHYVKSCETCQRVKPSTHPWDPLQRFPAPANCWKSMSLDFVFGLPANDKGNT